MKAPFKKLCLVLLLAVVLVLSAACSDGGNDDGTDTVTTDTTSTYTADTCDTTDETDDTDKTTDTTGDTDVSTDTDTSDGGDMSDTSDTVPDVGNADLWGPYTSFAEGQPDIRWLSFYNGIIDAYDESGEKLLRFTTSVNVIDVDFDPFIIVDIDFDGDSDILMLYNKGTVNSYYLCWLWNGEQFAYYEDFAFICSPYAREDKWCVSSWNRESAATYCYSEYEWINGELLLTFRADIDYAALTITYAWFDENGELVDMNAQEYESIEQMDSVDVEG